MSEDRLIADFFDYESLLTEEDRRILLRVREFMLTQVKPLANEYWERGEFPTELIDRFRESGLTKLYADAALSPMLSGMLSVEMSRVDPSSSVFFGVHTGLAMNTIKLGGDEAQRERFLPGMIAMDKIGAFALTEPEGGSDVAEGMRTTARRDGDSWVLNGAKKWIGNGTFADYIVVWARDEADDQVKAFVVHKGAPGFTATKIQGKIALRIVENAEITLTDVRVPEADRLQNIDSFRDAAHILGTTRGGVAWSAVGVMAGAYEAALEYAKNRVQFGRPIAGFQLIQDLLVRSLGDLTASWAMAVQMARLKETDSLRDDQAALAKAFTTSRMREVVARCREILGGNGILVDYDVARLFADAEALYSFEGTREMNTLIVGKSITGLSAFV
ncbi:acyl-CoA dehydrogenase [Pseudonocardiaceae bacterium YIM PH 21723]|nr:acyl-CoA dehydrogenase [Pseudonocardiaceae bacterium YIM PH 21723]